MLGVDVYVSPFYVPVTTGGVGCVFKAIVMSALSSDMMIAVFGGILLIYTVSAK